MNDPVSIIIPSYNHQDYICDAIESVLNQTYKNIELIIVDDGSTDNTLSILNTYKEENIKIFIQENSGAHNAINRGINNSSGMYISILNSDDVYYPNRIERLVEEAEKNNNASLLFSNIEIFGDCDRKSETMDLYKHMQDVNKKKDIDKNDIFLLGNLAFSTSNFFFPKKSILNVGAFRKLKFNHDWDWALRASMKGDVVWIKEPLLKYRVHEKNTIAQTNENILGSIEDNFILLSFFKNNDEIFKAELSSIFKKYNAVISNNVLIQPYIIGFILLTLMKLGEDKTLNIINDGRLLEILNQQQLKIPENASIFKIINYNINIMKLEDTVKTQEDLINSLYNSRSWKITKPLRSMDNFLKLIYYKLHKSIK